MAQYRELTCLYYVSHGNCTKHREADMYHYCQHCREYKPAARIKTKNKKKEFLRKKDYKKYEFTHFCNTE